MKKLSSLIIPICVFYFLLAAIHSSNAQSSYTKLIFAELTEIKHYLDDIKDNSGLGFNPDSVLKKMDKLNKSIENIRTPSMASTFFRKSYKIHQEMYQSWLKVKQAIVIFEYYTVLMDDTLLLKHTIEKGGKWQKNDNLDPWMQDLYMYNIKPVIMSTAFLTVANSLREFEIQCIFMEDKLRGSTFFGNNHPKIFNNDTDTPSPETTTGNSNTLMEKDFLNLGK